MKWDVINNIRDIIRSKEFLTLKKTEKKRKFVKIDGYDPANNAGTKESHNCTLILTEGLSAKTYAVKGIEVGFNGRSGRDWWSADRRHPQGHQRRIVNAENSPSASEKRGVSSSTRANDGPWRHQLTSSSSTACSPSATTRTEPSSKFCTLPTRSSKRALS